MPWFALAGAAISAGGKAAAAPAPPSGIFDSPQNQAPSYAGGGVWNVATSGSTARNSGSASTSQKSGAAAGEDYSKYVPLGMGILALVIAWKMLKK